jgi:hypothetical protein
VAFSNNGSVLSTTHFNGSVIIQPRVLLNISAPTSVFGSLELQPTSVLYASSTLALDGSLIVSATAEIVLSPSATLNVTGCLFAEGGRLIVPITGLMTNRILITYNCANYTEFETIEGVSDDPCKCVNTKVNYNSTALTAEFTITEFSGCSSDVPRDTRQQTILIVAIVVSIAGIILISSLIILLVPCIRRQVLPFKDRPHHQMRRTGNQ